MNRTTLEYSKNTVTSLFLAIGVFFLFYLLFGNTLLIWSAIAVVGMPHFILGALGYLAGNNKKIAGQFLAASLLGILLAVIYYSLPGYIAPAFFLIYFIWHLLTNEQMFESTIQTGYAKWQNSWPVLISWGSIVIVLLTLVIVAFYHLKLESSFLPILWVLFFILLITLIWSIFKERKGESNIPYGFLFFFVVILIPTLLLFAIFWQGEAFAPPILIALFHFVSWYVFYSKRLIKFPKDEQREGLGKLFFYWRKNVKQFWQVVAILQTIWIVLLMLYLYTPASFGVKFFVAPDWAPFWTIIHITTSFLPKKPLTLPNLELKLGSPKFSFK